MKLGPDTKISHYLIRSRIGKGGMGEVYLAEDTELVRKAAVKFLSEEFSGDEGKIKRFLHEARAASALNHPNILTVYETGTWEGVRYIATEYVEGDTLREILRHKESIPLKNVLKTVIQVAEALSAAHEAGIIHRDIKPENIMVRGDGYVKVLDFGLAKLTERTSENAVTGEDETRMQVRTEPGVVMGTASYMSPEQAEGRETDGRTDVWSLGVVLYEMLSGRVPFEGRTVNHTIVSILEKEPKLIEGVPNAVQRIVRKALTKEPEMRYQTARDLLIDLKNLKREMEFQGELERSVMPHREVTGVEGEDRDTKLMPPGPAQETDPDAGKRTGSTSSLEYAVSQVRSHKFPAIAIFAVVIALAGGTGYYFYRAAVGEKLTNRDVVLLTDFENTTGEKIFDGTLKQGLTMALEQSPFLSIFPDSEAHAALALMKKDPQSKITRDLGKDICLRKGLKAYVTGSISKLGSVYVLGLEAVNAKTGSVIAQTQKEASADDQKNILTALSAAATDLREKLGEPLAQIESAGKPVEATTSSLEALQFYSLGVDAGNNAANHEESIKFLEKAIELDPDFASAYSALAEQLPEFGGERTRSMARKAYELRDRVTDKERFQIEHSYLFLSEWDIEGAIDSLKAAMARYPGDYQFRFYYAMRLRDLGKYQQAFEEQKKSIEMMRSRGLELPPYQYTDLAYSLEAMNRFEEAKKVLMDGKDVLDKQNLEGWLFSIALDEGDAEGIRRGMEDENAPLRRFFYYNRSGRWKEAEATIEQVDREISGDAERGRSYSFTAIHTAALGLCSKSVEFAEKSVRLAFNWNTVPNAVIAFARCGDEARARKLLKEFQDRYPRATLVNKLTAPIAMAMLAMKNGRPEEAVRLLETARRFQTVDGSYYWVQRVRGEAYLALGERSKAVAEYRDILENPGRISASVNIPLAQLGIARATQDKKEYDKFFEIWKDADKDLPAMIAARKEYAELNEPT